ncbi:hypothetical protein JCGZ_22607 [Jatropha curcas]|uniref:SKP1-like protein n=1 Tax=Jatropha curcas TaxID=180498 RepID=A0A067JME9_JATCU|nr:SKP1-like protein 1A [Jatropha curcas]XP_037493567.1 SKP1-like protein 1A [Jatropha curcas]KDP25072.1 hypothetical protein JCGZ_22607 [Jatropha curcas]
MASTNANNSESATDAPTKKITLKTADDHFFEVEESVAMEFATVKTFFDDNTETMNGTVIPLPNVSAEYLSKIITYCREHLKFRAESVPEKERKAYDDNFVKELSNEKLREMILASNYLNIRTLLDVLNQAAADLIQNKSVEFVREFFGVENDFTPEEEERLRQENAWAFEGVDQD